MEKEEKTNKLFVDFDKVSDYLKENLYKYLYCVNGQAGFPTAQFIDDMKKQLIENRKREIAETYADAVLGNHDNIDVIMMDVNTHLKMMHND